MDIKKLLETLPEDRQAKLKQAIDNRFGSGYFGINAGIDVEDSPNEKYKYRATFCNFNSVCGWATIGDIRFDDKKNRYVINFSGRGLGRTGSYR